MNEIERALRAQARTLTQLRRHTHPDPTIRASAAPTVGSWQRGQVVMNGAPSPGEFIGWVCVEAGQPGTWKGFGLIES